MTWRWSMQELRGLVQAAQDRLVDAHPDGHGGEDEELFGLLLDTLAIKLAANWEEIYRQDEWPPVLDIATLLSASERKVLLVGIDEFGDDDLRAEGLEELQKALGDGVPLIVVPPDVRVREVRNHGGLTVISSENLLPEAVERLTDYLNEKGFKGILVANHKVGLDEIPAEALEAAGWVRKER